MRRENSLPCSDTLLNYIFITHDCACTIRTFQRVLVERSSNGHRTIIRRPHLIDAAHLQARIEDCFRFRTHEADADGMESRGA